MPIAGSRYSAPASGAHPRPRVTRAAENGSDRRRTSHGSGPNLCPLGTQGANQSLQAPTASLIPRAPEETSPPEAG
jgi:hypothetical protein